MGKVTQCEKILRYLDDYGSITRRDAAYELGIFEFAARISDLERKGFRFTKTSEAYTDRYGDTGHHKRYRLEVS